MNEELFCFERLSLTLLPLMVLETEIVKLEKADILEHSLGDILMKLSVLKLTVVSLGWGFC